jgi:hypothetical protein
MNNLQLMFLFHDTHCVNLLSMRRAPFFNCHLFRYRCLLCDSIHYTIEEQVAMFLHVVVVFTTYIFVILC